MKLRKIRIARKLIATVVKINKVWVRRVIKEFDNKLDKWKQLNENGVDFQDDAEVYLERFKTLVVGLLYRRFKYDPHTIHGELDSTKKIIMLMRRKPKEGVALGIRNHEYNERVLSSLRDMLWYLEIDMLQYLKVKNRDKKIDVANAESIYGLKVLPLHGVTTEEMTNAISTIKQTVDIIKKAGFRDVVSRRMNIYVNVFPHVSEATYAPGSDSITIYPGANVDSVVHEFGHRYYFKFMNSGRRNYWYRAFDDDLIEIQPTDIELLIDKLSKIIRLETDIDISRNMKKAIEHYRRDVKHDPVSYQKSLFFDQLTGAVQRLLDKHDEIGTYVMGDDDWNFIKDVFEERYAGKKVMKNPITLYANTNSAEAFAEVFKLYCTRKRVDGVVLHWFKEVTGV